MKKRSHSGINLLVTTLFLYGNFIPNGLDTYKQLFAETVSQSRNKWLNEMRGLISTILVVAKEECVLSKEPVASDEYLKARDEILLRLNMKESLHILLENEIEKLDHANSNNVDDISGKILTISRTILKEEWEKVKSEAKGGK